MEERLLAKSYLDLFKSYQSLIEELVEVKINGDFTEHRLNHLILRGVNVTCSSCSQLVSSEELVLTSGKKYHFHCRPTQEDLTREDGDCWKCQSTFLSPKVRLSNGEVRSYRHQDSCESGKLSLRSE